MSKAAKKVLISPVIPKPASRAAANPIEDFVAAGGAAREALVSEQPEPELEPAPTASPIQEKKTKRLTIDLDEKIHRRLRLYAAGDGRRLADIVRELLDRNLPKV